MPHQRKLQVTNGQRFGMLEVIDPEIRMPSEQASRPHGWRAALCRCDCGVQKAIRLNHLLSGVVISCGCQKSARWWRHGYASRGNRHPLYMTWALMMDRCHNRDSKDYPAWGGRGITVYPEWHDVRTFITWIDENIGPRPGGLTTGGRPEYTLDRYPDCDGNYEPGNVRWATSVEQQMNNGKHALRVRGISQQDLSDAISLLRRGGMPQQKIAAVIGVSQSTVSKYLHQRGTDG